MLIIRWMITRTLNGCQVATPSVPLNKKHASASLQYVGHDV